MGGPMSTPRCSTRWAWRSTGPRRTASPCGVLVDGSWLEGRIAANDGVGVVLESADGQHSVVRTERIAAVKVAAESPYRAPIESRRTTTSTADADARAAYATLSRLDAVSQPLDAPPRPARRSR